MPVDPYADTLRAMLSTIEDTIASGGAPKNWLEFIIANRPKWAAALAAGEAAFHSAQTAPIWRWVRVAGGNRVAVVRGTSMVATVNGVAGLASTLGIPLVVAAGTWVMLGAGYYQARQEIRRKGYMSGFSQGFVTGVLKWNWDQAARVLAMPFVIRKNKFDPVMDREEALGYNEGLRMGWGVGFMVPEYDRWNPTAKDLNFKRAYRIALRRLAGISASGPWSTHPDEARFQQRSYVVYLAAAGLRIGLIVPE
jgi:hypothetical protein